MPRTPLFPLPVNKAQNSPLPSISQITQTIDRIQISVDMRCLDTCLQGFGVAFGSHEVKIVNHRMIYSFRHERSVVQVVKYPSRGPNTRLLFSVAIQDPSQSAQVAVAGIIKKVLTLTGLPSKHASVTQVEVALDFVPADRTLLDDLGDSLSQSVVLKYARADSYNAIESTHYYGKKGNVRNGVKGLRCYPKEGARYRLELQLNRDFLRRKGINLDCFPLPVSFVNVLDLVKFYHPISQRAAENIVSNLSIFRSTRTLGPRVRGSILRRGPVMQQMDSIKRLQEKHGKKFDRDRVFSEWPPLL